ncbi:hypothetical protein OG767_10105 [Micromonospora sp. NBC_01392]|uniref:hypothetical protein n=1 Tax=Micromonospora sp. NBC_01392 TaxID=2903588 RepID=UPI00325145CF
MAVHSGSITGRLIKLAAQFCGLLGATETVEDVSKIPARRDQGPDERSRQTFAETLVDVDRLGGRFQGFVATAQLRQHRTEASNLYNELHRYDEEMTRRANEAYERDNPDATTRHREHGW